MRINILGPCGSGKSTLARELSEILNIPQYHIDKLFFNPNWEEKPREELREAVRSITENNEEWIIDGNYTDTIPLRFKEATLIIILDYPKSVYFTRVLKRIVKNRGQVRPDMAPGCPERLDFDFLKYVWKYDKEKIKPLLDTICSNINEGTKVLHFKKPKQTKQFLSVIKSTMIKD